MTADTNTILYCHPCGKPQHEVGRLIASGHFNICDECVRVAHDAMNDKYDGPPGRIVPPEEIPDKALLFAVTYYSKIVESTRAHLRRQVELLRKRGVGWDVIGEAIGATPEAAREQFS